MKNTSNVHEYEQREVVVGEVQRKTSYSTYFDEKFNQNGTPSDIDLEDIFTAPQENIENIVLYSKYCYRKYGIIMRVVNITRDFGATPLKLSYPRKNNKVKEAIEAYNERIDIDKFISDAMFELTLTGNLACYDRDGARVDIYPISQIEVIPLLKDNKPLLGYKIDNGLSNSIRDYPKEVLKAMETSYPTEVIKAIKENKEMAILDIENTHFAKINSSQYERYGLSTLMPSFDDLAHKSLMKEAEKSVANEVIDKIMVVKVGDKDNKPTKNLISEYNSIFSNVKGSVRATVPYYVDISYVEPETTIFENEKFNEVDVDILNTLGISLSLIRGESGGNYSEGIINFSGLTRTIEGTRRPILNIVKELYKAELKRNGLPVSHVPNVQFEEVVIDKNEKLALVKELFAVGSLPYKIFYEEYGYDFDSIKILKEEENAEGLDELFKTHSMPFTSQQGGEDGNDGLEDKGGAPTKSITERKSDKSQSNNEQPRTNLKNTNRSAKK